MALTLLRSPRPSLPAATGGGSRQLQAAWQLGSVSKEAIQPHRMYSSPSASVKASSSAGVAPASCAVPAQ